MLEVPTGNESLGVRTVLDNLSASGFSLSLSCPVKIGDKLLVITQISQAIVLLRGEVTSVEQDGPLHKLRLKITQHQIFSSLTQGKAGDLNFAKSTVRDAALIDASPNLDYA